METLKLALFWLQNGGQLIHRFDLYTGKYGTSLRWFKTVFRFPFQLNFMKGLLVCSKRLLLLVDS